MKDRSAEILVVGCDGHKIELFDVSAVTQDHLDKITPHLTDAETAKLRAARTKGYNTVQQFVYAVTAQNTRRTHLLMGML